MATLGVALLALAGLGAAAESVGPFTLHHTGLDPAGPQPAQVARDGTVASVTSSGDDQRGELSLQLWAGDNQQGGWGYGGVNLHGPATRPAAQGGLNCATNTRRKPRHVITQWWKDMP
ncbi:MAG: hypothetical protein EA402_11110 [Planctomycetota bacterium]|nr:MAG: hypothetical protein EA402_11110 [Planctomycetota bacterium]